MSPPAKFGDLLHEHRRRVGLTQDALGELAGVSERAISDLERGLRRAPHDGTIRRLADALDLNSGDREALQAFGQQPRRSHTRAPTTPVLDAPFFTPPALPTPTIGREKEIDAICAALRDDETRILTLIGPGGSGKTRLSIAAAGLLTSEFECGAAFVALASITDPNLVPGAAAEVLGVHGIPGVTLQASLTAYLREKSLLIVLDNFEQVTEAAPLLTDLVDACPRVRIVVSSRASLRLEGERPFPVGPLPVPDQMADLSLEELAQVPAVQLFVERARAVRPNFALTADNATVVADLCVRLEGLPLGIELAAARIRVLTPRAMLERLEHRLRLLVGGAHDLPERHQTMRAAILWSHDLLTAQEQALFRRLAIFSGGCTLAACEAVCSHGDAPGIDVQEALAALVGHSLVRHEEPAAGSVRFLMLETIRELAAEHLQSSPDASDIALQHACYYRDLAESLSPSLRGSERKMVVQLLRTERDNLRQALNWAISEDDPRLGQRVVAALDWWYRSEAPAEGQRWGEAVLALDSDTAATAERAATLASVGAMLRLQGDQAAAREWLDASVNAWRGLNDPVGLGHALALLGWSLTTHPDEASVALDESIRLLRENGSRWDLAFALLTQGMVCIAGGNVETARSVLSESVDLERSHKDAWLAGQALFYLGRLEAYGGALESAIARYQASLAIFKEVGDKFYTSTVLLDLAVASLLSGRFERTAALCEEGLALSRREGLVTGQAMHLTGLAAVISHFGDPAQAARLFSAGDALRERLDFQLGSFRSAYQSYIDAMRTRLGSVAFNVAWSKGRRMPISDAVAEALLTVRALRLASPVSDASPAPESAAAS